MGVIGLEKKRSNNFVNRCGGNVPFNKFFSGEEIHLKFYDKLTKEPKIHSQIVPIAHRV